MRGIGHTAALLLTTLLWLVVPVLFVTHSSATLKYKKQTGKKCLYCHSRVPDNDARDPLLNQQGKQFRDNGHRLGAGSGK